MATYLELENPIEQIINSFQPIWFACGIKDILYKIYMAAIAIDTDARMIKVGKFEFFLKMFFWEANFKKTIIFGGFHE